MPAEIKVRGLPEFTASMAKVERSFNARLVRGLRPIAQRVTSRIRSKVGRVGSQIHATATKRGIGISFPSGGGSARYDFYPWLDFGGSTGKGHHIGVAGSGSVKRDRIKGGRYIYPTLAEFDDEIKEAVSGVLLGLAHEEGFRTHG